MKKLLCLILSLIILAGCGAKVDEEALNKLSEGLEKRWEYTEQLSDEISIEDLENAVQIELDGLEKYEADDFKDTSLYVLYDDYRRGLDFIKTLMMGESINSPTFQESWHEHMEKRAKTLYDLNANYDLNIADEYKDTFEDVLSGAKYLVEAEKVEEGLSDIKALSDIEIAVDEKSVSITFRTESALSADSFVASKTGYPDKAIEILNTVKDYDYENIVISTTNQDTIAVSSYFTRDSLDKIDFDKWKELDSLDAYKFYSMADAYHIRMGIWESLDGETQRMIGDMNKETSNPFWKEYGFTH
ncbi:hypothetical protein [Halalkalibacterium halodurans]|uniref:hypothetical protein n=1 Tax=Halalkalibacterium halodurans TaxID=86665 RepID=UPI0010FD4749|nr:hypothetical protein [Halalkalibacterium halodurans]